MKIASKLLATPPSHELTQNGLAMVMYALHNTTYQVLVNHAHSDSPLVWYDYICGIAWYVHLLVLRWLLLYYIISLSLSVQCFFYYSKFYLYHHFYFPLLLITGQLLHYCIFFCFSLSPLHTILVGTIYLPGQQHVDNTMSTRNERNKLCCGPLFTSIRLT